MGVTVCAGEVCERVLPPTFVREGVRSPGLQNEFAVTVAERDQDWGKDSRLEDGEWGGLLLFVLWHCCLCHLCPGDPSTASNTLDLITWCFRAGRKQGPSCLSAAGDLSLVCAFSTQTN